MSVGKKIKKLDEMPEFEEEETIFKKVKSVEETISEFKVKLIEQLKTKRWKSIRVNIDDIAEVFGFTIYKQAFNWMPKRFRDESVRQGIHFKKARGRNYAIITVDDLGE